MSFQMQQTAMGVQQLGKKVSQVAILRPVKPFQKLPNFLVFLKNSRTMHRRKNPMSKNDILSPFTSIYKISEH